jgi:putative ABC transport system permease protein
VLMILLFPLFNSLAGKHLAIPWANPLFWLTVLCFTAFTGLIAGSYPAFYLSGFQPVKVLSGAFKAGPLASLPRKVLVVVQFTVSIALVIGILVVFRQIGYARSRPVGYTREGLITVNLTNPELQAYCDALRNSLLATGAVDDMAESSSPSTEVENSMFGYDWKGRDPNSIPAIETLFVTFDFGHTLDWKIKEGRDFSSSCRQRCIYPERGGRYFHGARTSCRRCHPVARAGSPDSRRGERHGHGISL